MSRHHHEDQHPGNVEETPSEAQKTNLSQQPEDETEQATPHDAELSTPATRNAEGFRYSPLPPQEDTQAYTFQQDKQQPN